LRTIEPLPKDFKLPFRRFWPSGTANHFVTFRRRLPLRFVLYIILFALPAASGSCQEGTARIDTTGPIIPLAAGAGYAADHAPAPAERSATVCIEAGSSPSTFQSRSLASKMFARIGVAIHWRFGLHGCPQQAIVLSLSSRTPPTLQPGSLAYSLPYEGRHILVLYDRIAEDRPGLVRFVLAYVLVHEITHLLQAEDRHSPSGIMKAHWGENDFEDMKRGALAFTAEDIDLIYRGLAARARARAVAEGK
jgi:hypothetical protein